jgi:hypothetical protein
LPKPSGATTCNHVLTRHGESRQILSQTVFLKRDDPATSPVRDRSIAIAHGLEDLCEVKAPEKKAKRGKKHANAELELGEG